MNKCPVCRGALDPNTLLAPALDVYRGSLFAYARCPACLILILQNPAVTGKDVDYSGSGYYRKEKARWSGLFDKVIALYTAHRIAITRNAVGGNSLGGKRILDIGCGKGRFLARAQQLGAIVSGVEPTRRSYEEAKSRLNDAVQNRIMEKDLFAAGTFDVITMWHVFEHIPDPVSMLSACHDALAPAGKLIVAVPNYKGLIAKLGGAAWFNLDPPRHLVHYDPRGLAALLSQNGFKVFGVNHTYPELTFLSALQTLLNKLPITGNFLFNYLKRNAAGLPQSRVRYFFDLAVTAVAGLLLAPLVLLTVPLLSLSGKSDCITLIARKR